MRTIVVRAGAFACAFARASACALAGGLGIALMVATACAPAGAGSGEEPSPSHGNESPRGHDRVVIPSMSIVSAVGVSDRYTFIATPNGLGVFDRRFNEWLPPVTRIDGWPDANVTVMLADPADPSAVWFGADNMVFHYRVGFDEIVRTLVPDRVSPNAFFVDPSDMSGGVIVGSAAGYLRVSATGGVLPYTPIPTAARPAGARARIGPQTVASVYAQFPALQGYERLITQDAQLRSWPVISAASTPGVSEVWLGTAGGGLFKADPVFFRGEAIPYGLIGEGAGAVARGVDGVWFGSLGGAAIPRGGVTFTDPELRTWKWLDGGAGSPLSNARVTSMAPSGSTLWIATDRGVMHVDARTGGVLRRWDDMAGLPNSAALAVEPTEDGAWVGTLRGLAFVRDTGGSRASSNDVTAATLFNTPVRALVRRGDTLWIGSERGVYVLPSGETQPRPLRAASGDSRLSTAVAAIATADSVVVVANTIGDVFRVSTRTGEALDAVSIAGAARVGRVYGLAIDAATIWIAGERGVLVVQRDTRVQRLLAAGQDVPADAFGVALTPRYAWIATRGGGVRIRRTDDGMVR